LFRPETPADFSQQGITARLVARFTWIEYDEGSILDAVFFNDKPFSFQLFLKFLPNSIKQIFLEAFSEEPYSRRIGNCLLKIQETHERDILDHFQIHPLI
jgi:hypothetical protein